MGVNDWLIRAVQTLRRVFRSAAPGGPPTPDDDSLIFAVTKCYPTRIALYAAAFQGRWKVQFLSSLEEALAESLTRRPRAVFYDHMDSGTKWDGYCSALAAQGIPFILLAHRSCDETFMTLLGCGGFHAWGNPLASEDIVKAVEFAEEVTSLSHAPVG